MSGSRQFVDTNVLVYAHDVTAGDKYESARALIEELRKTREGCVSVQVLQEFFVTTTRKIPKPLDASVAVRVINDLASWHVHAPTVNDELAVIDIHDRAGASFWGRDYRPQREGARLQNSALRGSQLRPDLRRHPGPKPVHDLTGDCLYGHAVGTIVRH